VQRSMVPTFNTNQTRENQESASRLCSELPSNLLSVVKIHSGLLWNICALSTVWDGAMATVVPRVDYTSGPHKQLSGRTKVNSMTTATQAYLDTQRHVLRVDFQMLSDAGENVVCSGVAIHIDCNRGHKASSIIGSLVHLYRHN